MAVIGIVAAAFAILTARRLGYRWQTGAGLLWFSVLLLGAALMLPSFSNVDREEGWIIAGNIALGLGAVLLFMAVSKFEAASADAE